MNEPGRTQYIETEGFDLAVQNVPLEGITDLEIGPKVLSSVGWRFHPTDFFTTREQSRAAHTLAHS